MHLSLTLMSLFSHALFLSHRRQIKIINSKIPLSLSFSLSQYFNFILQNKNQTLFLSQSSVSLRLPTTKCFTTACFACQSHLFISSLTLPIHPMTLPFHRFTIFLLCRFLPLCPLTPPMPMPPRTLLSLLAKPIPLPPLHHQGPLLPLPLLFTTFSLTVTKTTTPNFSRFV